MRIINFVRHHAKTASSTRKVMSTKRLNLDVEEYDFIWRSLTRDLSFSYSYEKINTLLPTSSQNSINYDDSIGVSKSSGSLPPTSSQGIISDAFDDSIAFSTSSGSFSPTSSQSTISDAFDDDSTDLSTSSGNLSPISDSNSIGNKTKSFDNDEEKKNNNENQTKNELDREIMFRSCNSTERHQENCKVDIDLFYEAKMKKMNLDFLEPIDNALLNLVANSFLLCSNGGLSSSDGWNRNLLSVEILDPSRVYFFEPCVPYYCSLVDVSMQLQLKGDCYEDKTTEVINEFIYNSMNGTDFQENVRNISKELIDVTYTNKTSIASILSPKDSSNNVDKALLTVSYTAIAASAFMLMVLVRMVRKRMLKASRQYIPFDNEPEAPSPIRFSAGYYSGGNELPTIWEEDNINDQLSI